jgi:hypothetical protein
MPLALRLAVYFTCDYHADQVSHASTTRTSNESTSDHKSEVRR